MESMILRARGLHDLCAQVSQKLIKTCDKHKTEQSPRRVIEFLSEDCPICRMERDAHLKEFDKKFGEMTMEEFMNKRGDF